jgi:hypothetical protein
VWRLLYRTKTDYSVAKLHASSFDSASTVLYAVSFLG